MSRSKFAVCVAAVLTVAVCAPASAQPAYNWSGFYVGGNAGKVFGSGSAVAVETSPEASYNDFGDTWGFDVDGGATYGAQVGYNLQNGNLVFGAEVDLGQFGFEGSEASPLGPGGDTVGFTKGGFSTGFRGRVGYATGRWLVFGTAGVLSVGTKASVEDNCDQVPCGPLQVNAEGDSRRTGGIFGAGIEYALASQGRYQISVKAEYLGAAIDNYVTEVTGVSDGDNFAWDIATEPANAMFRVGVNFRFP